MDQTVIPKQPEHREGIKRVSAAGNSRIVSMVT